MSRSATPATRNEATTRLKPSKITTSAELPIGTAIRSSRGRLRTVANGCDRERNVERTHPQPPDPQTPRVKREPLLRIRENAYVCCFQSKRKPKNSYVYSFRVKETRLYIVLWKPRKQMYQCIFPQSTEDYRKMNKILPNFCTLKTELWVRGQTARCCNFCPPCFESYI